MSFIRGICSQRKAFGAILYRLNSSISVQHKFLKKKNILSLRFCHSVVSSLSLKSRKQSSAYEKSLLLGDLKEPDLILLSDRFGIQGLDLKNTKKYDVGVSDDFSMLLFPLSNSSDRYSAFQSLIYNQEGNSYIFSELHEPVLFGWPLINAHDKVLIVTSDPLDAIAVNQATNLAAVSVPVLDDVSYSFPPEVLDLFNTFNKVIFWMKEKLHSLKIRKLLGSVLKEKGYVVRPQDFKKPLFYLQNSSNIKEILMKAEPIYIKKLDTIGKRRDAVYQYIMKTQAVCGIQWKRFSPLNAILKGHRKGELTIITGHTGTGKTTLMCEYALDLCMQGVETLWISLEVSNDTILSTMLTQFSQIPEGKVGQNYDYLVNKFDDELPISLISIQDCSSLEEIFHVMKAAVFGNDIRVKHIIVDNLQFMMNWEDHNSVLDQLRRQDQMFGAFRKFSSTWNCHITLVVHPRKEQEFSVLTIASISGTAKATQEADNVLIIQSTRTKRYLEVSKNRFNGDKGCVLLEFDKDTKMYTMKELQSQPKH